MASLETSPITYSSRSAAAAKLFARRRKSAFGMLIHRLGIGDIAGVPGATGFDWLDLYDAKARKNRGLGVLTSDMADMARSCSILVLQRDSGSSACCSPIVYLITCASSRRAPKRLSIVSMRHAVTPALPWTPYVLVHERDGGPAFGREKQIAALVVGRLKPA